VVVSLAHGRATPAHGISLACLGLEELLGLKDGIT
jgi:hypothetical protein